MKVQILSLVVSASSFHRLPSVFCVDIRVNLGSNDLTHFHNYRLIGCLKCGHVTRTGLK